MGKIGTKILIGIGAAVGLWLFFIFVFPFFFIVGTNTYLKTPDGEETYYYRKMGLIHHRNPTNIFSLMYSPVWGAHKKSFVPLDYRVARDRKYIYYRGVRQPRIDRETFEIIIDTTAVRRNGDFEHIYRDKNHVWDCEWYEDELHPVE